ncbi:MAG: hypothetical protein SFX73_26240 [Kofleriaceae bacterium]|nr:hypothetical protein [Kofleriaceae bacterium]
MARVTVPAAPFQALRARAAAKRRAKSVATIDRVLAQIAKRTGGATAPAVTLGTKLASVATEGGPPLVVPAEHLAAWLGVVGPKPFDIGERDYERACDAKRPSVLTVGNGHGVVLDEQGCDVHAEEAGLLFVLSGDPGDAVARAWKKVGAIAVSAKGLVVLDAAEVGAEKGVNRARVPLAAGTYDVRSHRPGGAGADYNAVRFVRTSSAAR